MSASPTTPYFRCSYGIIVREPYDPQKHRGAYLEQDPHYNERWADGQIHWLIKQVCRCSTARLTICTEWRHKQDDTIPNGSYVSEEYQRKMQVGEEEKPWRMHIVQSTLPIAELPSSMKDFRADEVQQVCSVITTFASADLKRRNNHWYNLGEEYYLARFEVRACVDREGLQFVVKHANGIRSSPHAKRKFGQELS